MEINNVNSGDADRAGSRRHFLKVFGLIAGTTMVNTNVIAGFVKHEEVKKLKPDQRKFMLRYGKWMDEFTEAVRIQKNEPDNLDNKRHIMLLAAQADNLKPELSVFMKDETFSLVYQVSIRRMSEEIESRKG